MRMLITRNSFSRIYRTMILIGALHTARKSMVSSFVGSLGRIELIATRPFVNWTKKGVATIHNVYVSRSRNPSRPFIQKFEFSNADPATRADSSQYDDEESDTALDRLLQSSFAESEDPDGFRNDIHQEETKGVTDPDFLRITNPIWQNAGLNPMIIDVLSSKGITSFTPVQGEAFKPVLSGRDVIGRSRTGTGKTLAFGLPSLHRLVSLAEEKGLLDSSGRRLKGRNTSMLILCPTRELARQVQEELDDVAKPLGLFTTVFHGGVPYDSQARALRQGIDVLVGTPGRVIDHIERGNLNLSECEIVVLDEADEMLNMGFAEDVEVILDGVGSANKQKTQCLLFSATTPSWVKEIGQKYQENVVSIDASSDNEARTAKTIRHVAIQLPPGNDAKRDILEDIISVEISKDVVAATIAAGIDGADASTVKKGPSSMHQKIFGKTIVFVEMKKDADELVSGGVFKSLTAQALHGDVGQKQRDATLNAFRAGAFSVLVATDVAARGIDIKDVDLVVQFSPPREVDTYVHRSGRTGRAGRKGTSVLLFDSNQARDIVKIEKSLGHGFKFELSGPPSVESALEAAAKASAFACRSIPDETSEHFKSAATALLQSSDNPADVVAKCLAAISRRSNSFLSRSLLTGESGYLTIEMSNTKGRPVSTGDVMFTVSKLARMSRRNDDEDGFDGDVGKIQINPETGVALFDMPVADAKKLAEYSRNVDAGGAAFRILKELAIERKGDFGALRERRDRPMRSFGRNDRGRGRVDNDSWDTSRGGGRPSNRFDSFHQKTPSRPNYETRTKGGSDGDRNRSKDFSSERRTKKSEDGW